MRPKDPMDKVRELQRKLFTAAKRSRRRRFHALYDRIYRGDVLAEALKRVRKNGEAAGVDGESLSINRAARRRGVPPRSPGTLEEVQVPTAAGAAPVHSEG